MYGFIYITTNNINGKKYIGQKKYDKKSTDYLGSGVALNNAIKKYGKENFTKEIIDEGINREELNEKEKYWIKFYDAVNSKDYYNIASGGDGGDTQSGHTQEEKEQISQYRSSVMKGKINIGAANKSAKKVICLNTMEIFDCAADAERKYGFRPESLCKVCNPNESSKTLGVDPISNERLRWEYYDPKKTYVYTPYKRNYIEKKILCVNNGKIYKSANEVSKIYDIPAERIRAGCRYGRTIRKLGLKFKYI